MLAEVLPHAERLARAGEHGRPHVVGVGQQRERRAQRRLQLDGQRVVARGPVEREHDDGGVVGVAGEQDGRLVGHTPAAYGQPNDRSNPTTADAHRSVLTHIAGGVREHRTVCVRAAVRVATVLPWISTACGSCGSSTGIPSGVVRGKQVHAARLPDALTSGLGLTRAQNALNLLDDLVPVDGHGAGRRDPHRPRPGHVHPPPLARRRREHALRPGRPRRPRLGRLPARRSCGAPSTRSPRPGCASRPPSRTSSTSPRTPRTARDRGATGRSTPRPGSTGRLRW